MSTVKSSVTRVEYRSSLTTSIWVELLSSLMFMYNVHVHVQVYHVNTVIVNIWVSYVHGSECFWHTHYCYARDYMHASVWLHHDGTWMQVKHQEYAWNTWWLLFADVFTHDMAWASGLYVVYTCIHTVLSRHTHCSVTCAIMRLMCILAQSSSNCIRWVR
jgi:hypothetical protein